MLQKKEKQMRCKRIKKFCDKHFETDISEYNQSNESLASRWVYYILCYKYSFASTAEIGKYVNREHPSVLNGLKQADAMITINKDKGFISTLQTAEHDFLNTHVLDQRYFEYDGLDKIELKRKCMKLTKMVASKTNSILWLNKKINKLQKLAS